MLKKLFQQCLFLGTQQKDRVKTVTGDTLKRPASAIRTDALIAVIELTAIVKDHEVPTFDFDFEKPGEEFVLRLSACSLRGVARQT